MSDDQGWRLKAELEAVDRSSALDRVLGRLRGPDVARDAKAEVPRDVVVTHDGRLLFAYADSEPAIRAARGAIENVLAHDGVRASIVIGCWDELLDEWRQVDPPLTGDQARAAAIRERDAEAEETRTMVASAGKMIRASFEQSLLAWAQKLGLQCEVIEHPHLLTTQVAFTVTGPRGKLEDFDRALKAEEAQTMRAEGLVMISPL